jgi:hypothetical protein
MGKKRTVTLPEVICALENLTERDYSLEEIEEGLKIAYARASINSGRTLRTAETDRWNQRKADYYFRCGF